MKYEIITNDYLLAYYIMFGPCISNEIDKIKKQIYIKYKNEYNACYKDKTEIIKYGKDYIPNDDLIYNIIMETKIFKEIKKETKRYAQNLENALNKNKEEINKQIKKVLRVELDNIKIYVIHPKFELKEEVLEHNSIVFSHEKNKIELFINTIIDITKYKYHLQDEKYNIIIDSILELAIENEIKQQIIKKPSYQDGNDGLIITKKQIYPYFLMYLGIIEPEEMLNKIIKNKILININNIKINDNLKKLNIIEFIEYIIKNNNKILNYKELKKVIEIEEIESI